MSASRQSCLTSSGIEFKLSDSVMELRDFPRRCASSSWVYPNRRVSDCMASAFFKRREVLALNILDQRKLDQLRIIDIPNDDWDLPHADLNRRLIAPLPAAI